PIEFSDAQLNEMEVSIDRYYSTVLRINDFLELGGDADKIPASVQDFEKQTEALREKFRDAMDDDFNSALALGNIFEFIREVNKFLDAKPSGQKAKEIVSRAKDALVEVGNVLNIFNKSPEQWYSALMKVKSVGFSEDDIMKKIAQRQEARQKKDWAQADAVRKELEEKGIILEDKKDTTRWKIKVG
ncbi:MAG: cysteine--tRNA ligase, partial [Nitrospirae bacterium]|nr:cysteine--tRNA ligase [Nitrospirota bacterium]